MEFSSKGKLLNPFNHPICFAIPERRVPSAWHEHVPFAMFLVDILRPKVIVELGTQYGESYCAFCQAVKNLNLDVRCYAVDTWQGDPHASLYGPEVLADLRAHHDLLYGSFSRLIQSTFDEALVHFADETISLLHVDGYHTYEAVKRDFETWLPKMRRDGVILFHDVNVLERDFGVREFWDEIKTRYQHFEFLHGHGLGVLAVGKVNSIEFQELLDASENEAFAIRDFFFQLGNRIELKFENDNKARALLEKTAHIEKQQEALNSLEYNLTQRNQDVAAKEQAVQALSVQLAEKDNALQTLASEAAEDKRRASALSVQLAELEHAAALLSAQVEEQQSALETIAKEKEEISGNLLARLAEQQRALETIAREKEEISRNLLARLAEHEQNLLELTAHLADRQAQLTQMASSLGGRLLSIYGRRIKYPYLLPLYRLYGRIKYPYLLPIYRWLGLMPKPDAWSQIPKTQIAQSQNQTSAITQSIFTVDPLEHPLTLKAHSASVDVIVCVHNALEDVKLCLESVGRYTTMPYSLILVDDGSSEETRDYLADFASYRGIALIRNEQAKGYTLAANQGLRESKADYVVLLNSDTVVTPSWIDRMIGCAESDPSIGLVGPLSNAATWQSIPEIISNGEFAENSLPEGLSITDMGGLVAQYSGRLYPHIPFLNGFCMLIKRRVIEEIGYFDEEVFGPGYGEENDYGLRARNAGWQLAVADDAYVYHAQSRSYSHERRKELSRHAGKALAAKHGQQIIEDGVAVCRYDRVLEGIRARSQVMITRQRLIEQGKALWQHKRVLFLLPIPGIGGGGNVVLDEAEAMTKMGVDVTILNLVCHKTGFKRDYPDNDLPVIFVRNETEISPLLPHYDAVIATWYTSVDWLTAPSSATQHPVKGYYIQSFEPFLFNSGSAEFKQAWNSYTQYPDLVRVTKTEWNRDVVKEKTGVDCAIVGPSVNIDMYRPRGRGSPDWPRRPLRIAAMVRANSPYRAPELTMEVLREIHRAHGETIEIILFGCHSDVLRDLGTASDFSYRLAGVLTRLQTAALLNEADIFVDFSSWQTMGLTAMEAMCCGAAVIVPQSGGAGSFVRHEQNGISVDTSSREACLTALERLVTDVDFRTRIQRRAISDICQFFRERAAFGILNAIFQEPRAQDSALRSGVSENMAKAQVAGARPEAVFPPRGLASIEEVLPLSLSETHPLKNESVGTCRYDRVQEGKRARSQVFALREQLIEQGRASWDGKRLLFVLPISERSGGGNVVLDEAEAMRKMGVKISVVNLSRYRERFERHYYDNTLPVIYVNEASEISDLLPNYDAVIATWCASVDWLTPGTLSNHHPIRGYYVQDFEPQFFNEGSKEFKIAWGSYTRYPDLVRVTKTEWNRARVKEKIGVECTVVGPSVNLDLYFPRKRKGPDWPHRPLRIAAMIRPSTPHRAPKLTLELLREFYRAHQETTELHFFGCDTYDLRTLGIRDDFHYRNEGILTRPQIAALFNEIDIFADFSNYQAMGLTAMEAMCCGAAVIAPKRGGAVSFLKHEANGILTDTSSRIACLTALERLTTDVELRTRLQRQATVDICQFFPERAAFNILSAMFHERSQRHTRLAT